MAFNLSTIQADARFLVFGDSTNTQYGATDINRGINAWYGMGIVWILKTNGTWQVNGEKATTDIVTGQQEYILPTDILKLNEVYVKDINGNYILATERDPSRISQYPDANYFPASPEYDLLDNSIFLYMPTAITGSTAGLRIDYQSNLVELSANGDLPNIAEPFKRLLSYGSALDYCIANELAQKAATLEQQIALIKDDMIEFYASRSTVKRKRLVSRDENYK